MLTINLEPDIECQLVELAKNAGKPVNQFIEMLLENYQAEQFAGDELSNDEQMQIEKIITQIQQTDYSEFEDWETVKARL